MERIKAQDADSWELAEHVLSWIIFAERQLMTTELQHALAVEVGELELNEENLPQIEDMVSVCAGLVTVDEESNIIRLVHYTTQEYFERTQIHWFPNAESNITTTCVTYLSFRTFESGHCYRNVQFKERLRLNKLYDYAAHNWGHHARKASTLCHGVLNFLECESKLQASIQVLMAVEYGSQHGPRQMKGLHLAAYFGVQDAVNALIDKGYLDFQDSYRRTPLSWAAENGHEVVVKLLLEKGAELETKDEECDWTPLSWAAENGHEAAVKLLVEKSAELETKDEEYGRTPLSWAAENGHEVVVKLLVEKGAELETKDKNYDRTPLSLAAENGREAVVKLLLKKGAKKPQ